MYSPNLAGLEGRLKMFKLKNEETLCKSCIKKIMRISGESKILNYFTIDIESLNNKDKDKNKNINISMNNGQKIMSPIDQNKTNINYDILTNNDCGNFQLSGVLPQKTGLNQDQSMKPQNIQPQNIPLQYQSQYQNYLQNNLKQNYLNIPNAQPDASFQIPQKNAYLYSFQQSYFPLFQNNFLGYCGFGQQQLNPQTYKDNMSIPNQSLLSQLSDIEQKKPQSQSVTQEQQQPFQPMNNNYYFQSQGTMNPSKIGEKEMKELKEQIEQMKKFNEIQKETLTKLDQYIKEFNEELKFHQNLNVQQDYFNKQTFGSQFQYSPYLPPMGQPSNFGNN